jgi:hypothetical protein
MAIIPESRIGTCPACKGRGVVRVHGPCAISRCLCCLGRGFFYLAGFAPRPAPAAHLLARILARRPLASGGSR